MARSVFKVKVGGADREYVIVAPDAVEATKAALKIRSDGIDEYVKTLDAEKDKERIDYYAEHSGDLCVRRLDRIGEIDCEVE